MFVRAAAKSTWSSLVLTRRHIVIESFNNAYFTYSKYMKHQVSNIQLQQITKFFLIIFSTSTLLSSTIAQHLNATVYAY